MKDCHGGTTPMSGAGLPEETKKNISKFWEAIAEEKKVNEEK